MENSHALVHTLAEPSSLSFCTLRWHFPKAPAWAFWWSNSNFLSKSLCLPHLFRRNFRCNLLPGFDLTSVSLPREPRFFGTALENLGASPYPGRALQQGRAARRSNSFVDYVSALSSTGPYPIRRYFLLQGHPIKTWSPVELEAQLLRQPSISYALHHAKIPLYLFLHFPFHVVSTCAHVCFPSGVSTSLASTTASSRRSTWAKLPKLHPPKHAPRNISHLHQLQYGQLPHPASAAVTRTLFCTSTITRLPHSSWTSESPHRSTLCDV